MLVKGGHKRGFSILELLIVITIIGVIAAIAIPNLLKAMNRGKQKRTMSDIRTIGVSVESYSVDNDLPPQSVSQIILANIQGHLEPTFIKILPAQDAWKAQFVYRAKNKEYSLRSFGKDGVSEGEVGPGETRNYNCDIIFSDGQFVRYPVGAQD
ncbi:type II secretion system protein GspG [Acidobacteriota bacterium]